VKGPHDKRAFVVVADQARERREGVVVEGCVIRPGRIVGRDDRTLSPVDDECETLLEIS